MNSDTEANKLIAPTGYDNPPPEDYDTPPQDGYAPSVTATSSAGTVRIKMDIELSLDPERLRCLQDQGITCTSNVVT